MEKIGHTHPVVMSRELQNQNFCRVLYCILGKPLTVVMHYSPFVDLKHVQVFFFYWLVWLWMLVWKK